MSDVDQIEDLTAQELGFDAQDRTILTIARFVFVSFNRPDSQAWMSAFELGEAHFGTMMGPHIASRIAHVVRTMSVSRKSCFRFNNPVCPCCRNKVAPGERYLMAALSATRRGRSTEAGAYMMMVTEGGDCAALRTALKALSYALPRGQLQLSNETR